MEKSLWRELVDEKIWGEKRKGRTGELDRSGDSRVRKDTRQKKKKRVRKDYQGYKVEEMLPLKHMFFGGGSRRCEIGHLDG